MSWRDEASCRDSNPDLFFPEWHGKQLPTRQARAICSTCPVTAECLAYANEAMEPFGIWGGMSPRERKEYRARNGALPGQRPLVGKEQLAEVEGLTSQEAAKILGVAASTVRQYRRQLAEVS